MNRKYYSPFVFAFVLATSLGSDLKAQAQSGTENLSRRIDHIYRTAPKHLVADLALAEFERDHSSADEREISGVLGRIARTYSMPMQFHADAIGVYRKIMELMPANLHARLARYSIATEFERAGRREDAVEMLHIIHAEAPLTTRARTMATLCSELGRFDEADAFYRLASPTRGWLLSTGSTPEDNAYAEHLMRAGHWERALEYWNTNPAMEFPMCGLGASVFDNVWLQLRKATCLRALGRPHEALEQLESALAKYSDLLGMAECAALAVEIRRELGQSDYYEDPGSCNFAGQTAYLISDIRNDLAAKDLFRLCELLLNDDDRYGKFALRAAKRELIRLVAESNLPIASTALGFVGRNNDRWICNLLAMLGDDGIVDRVRERLDHLEGSWERRRWLTILVVLDTDRAYGLLREYSLSSDPDLQREAEAQLRRFPQGWPLPPIDKLFY